MFLKPRIFGMRMWIGVWPPSNQPGIPGPLRASWPFVPLPAVLPWPDEIPRPTRRCAFRAPCGARSSCCLMSLPVRLLVRAFAHLDQVRDPAQHAAHGLRIRLLDALARPSQAERFERAACGDLLADGAAVLTDDQARHGATGSGSARLRRMSTPRISVIRCEERRAPRAFIVAMTTFTGFVLPSDFDRMSLMPADSTTARTEPPAMTPVPFDAGRSRTFAAPKSAVTGCGIVRSTSGTRMSCFFASAMPFVMAAGTSSAFPRPAPTCPRPSPTTTTAEKLKDRKSTRLNSSHLG